MANYIAYDDKIAAGGNFSGTAATVEYDNTTSGLTATNTQNAIDEVNSKASITETTDNEPYIIRQGKGDLVDLELIGGSVGWNQKSQTFNSDNYAFGNCSSSSFSDGVATFTVSAQYGGIYGRDPGGRVNLIAGHKYLCSVSIKTTTATTGVRYRFTSNSTTLVNMNVSASTNWQTLASIISPNSSIDYVYHNIDDTRSSGWDAIQVKYGQCINLTLALGSTVADYIYSLEQSTAGSGVAFFRKYFPNAYYAYDAGSIQSVCASGRKVVGKNLLGIPSSVTIDERTFTRDNEGYCRAVNTASDPRPWRYSKSQCYSDLPAGNYKFIYEIQTLTDNTNASCYVYTSDGDTLASANFTADPGIHQTNFTLEKASNIGLMYKLYDAVVRFMIVSSSVTDLSYSPYTSTTCAFDSSKELRGVPKLVDNKLNYDGDVYRADGSIARKYGIVDLGTLNWNTIAGGFYPNEISDSAINIQNAICSAYTFNPSANRTTGSEMYSLLTNKQFAWYYNLAKPFIRDDSYTDAATFKTAMSGVYLVYELATPTTESASAYQNPQRSYSDGTEQFIDGITRDVMVPVGNISTYYENNTINTITNYVDGATNYISKEEELLGNMKDGDTILVNFEKYRFIRIIAIINGVISYNGYVYNANDFNHFSGSAYYGVYYNIYQDSSHYLTAIFQKISSNELSMNMETFQGWSSSSTYIHVTGII